MMLDQPSAVTKSIREGGLVPRSHVNAIGYDEHRSPFLATRGEPFYRGTAPLQPGIMSALMAIDWFLCRAVEIP